MVLQAIGPTHSEILSSAVSHNTLTNTLYDVADIRLLAIAVLVVSLTSEIPVIAKDRSSIVDTESGKTAISSILLLPSTVAEIEV